MTPTKTGGNLPKADTFEVEHLNSQTKGTATGWQSMGTDRSKGTEITGGPRIQVRAFMEKRTWDGQKTETERAGYNPVLPALDCY